MKKKQSTSSIKIKVILCMICCLIIFPVYFVAQELPEQYREKFSESFPIRKKQHLDLNEYLDKLIEESLEKCLTFFKPDFSSIEMYINSLSSYRKMFFKVIGYPPQREKSLEPRFVKVGEDSKCIIYRVWLEVVDGVDAYGIYMVPRNLKGKAPLLVCIHGGSGCPEAICGLDTREPYHNMGWEAVKRGYIVWAPGLIDQVSYGGDPKIEGADRRTLDRKSKLIGTSLAAILIYKINRSIEALIQYRPEIDPERIGMTGLSRGGRYTLLTAASCPLIRVAVCSGFFSDHATNIRRSNIMDPERPVDINILKSFGHAQLVGLVCPRPLMVQMGLNDSVIPIEGARREAPKAALYYQKLGIGDRFKFFEHSGGHEFHLESLFSFFDKHL